MADPFSVKVAKVDGEDWLNDENENALIDMWQTKPLLYDVIIIIGFLKLKKFVKINLSLDHVLVSCSKLSIC